MKMKLSYYEDETVTIDMRDGRIDVRFKYEYSKKNFEKTLLIVASIVDALNDLNAKYDRPERLTPETSQKDDVIV